MCPGALEVNGLPPIGPANGTYWRFGEGGSGMEAYGIVGLTFGIIGFIFAMGALDKISKLEKQLKETGVLDKEYKSG